MKYTSERNAKDATDILSYILKACSYTAPMCKVYSSFGGYTIVPCAGMKSLNMDVFLEDSQIIHFFVENGSLIFQYDDENALDHFLSMLKIGSS